LAAKNPKGKTYWRKNFKDKHANLAKNPEGKHPTAGERTSKTNMQICPRR
jgi:hypothetical protein